MGKGRPRKGALKEKVVSLAIHPPADQSIRKTNQLAYLSRTILHALIRHDESWPFLELITPKKIDIPHYYDLVPNPMSLRVIKKRLLNNYYWSADQAIQDISLVFQNAYRTTGPQSAMTRMARDMETLFLAHLQAMPQPEVEIELNGKPVQSVRPATIPKYRKIPNSQPIPKNSEIPKKTELTDNSHDIKNDPDEQWVSSSDAVKTEPMMVDYDDSLFQCGTDEKMEFALRRLERFFGIDRSEVTATYIHSDSTVDTVKLEDVCQINIINSNTNNGNTEDSSTQIRSQLDNLETAFLSYSDRYDQELEMLRTELVTVGQVPPATSAEEKILIGTTQNYSYTQENEITQFIIHDSD